MKISDLNVLAGVSSVNNLFFKGQMESKISEANSHGDIFISVCDFSTMAISCVLITV